MGGKVRRGLGLAVRGAVVVRPETPGERQHPGPGMEASVPRGNSYQMTVRAASALGGWRLTMAIEPVWGAMGS